MKEISIASLLLTAVAAIACAAPASALISAHLPGGQSDHQGGGVPHMPKPMPRPAMQGGGCCGGPMVGAGGHYGGSSHRMIWAGKLPLGTHARGMHFYGMGDHSAFSDHVSRQFRLGSGMGWGARALGGGSSAGGYGMTVPSGMHPMGMHFYGMSGGSLAAKYGHLNHDYGALYGAAAAGWRTGATPSPTWSPWSGLGTRTMHRSASHVSYTYSFKETTKRRFAFLSKRSRRYGGQGSWSRSGPTHWTYGMN